MDLFKTSCPGCGAEVAFRSATSVMAVCSYCQTLVLKRGAEVTSGGKLSAVFEDYTPLQIGTGGLLDGQAFTLVGRLQLTYADGHWNEWYALFDDGRGGWLADASGQYVFTVQAPGENDAPLFDKLEAGNRWMYDGRRWIACDVRSAQARAGQGELPFAIGEGWEARVADFRTGREFLTLDYSFADAPAVFRGKAVTLDELKCQLLRDEQAVFDAAGRYKGGLDKLDCPHCGSPIAHAPGLTSAAVCAACHSEIAIEGERAEVLATHEQLQAHATTLQLGDTAKIDGGQYVLIGAMSSVNPEDDEQWTEYLLFSPARGFLWLVETGEGWQRVRVLDDWPDDFDGRHVHWHGGNLRPKWQYAARVTWAAGAFNWRVRVGDTRVIIDYDAGMQTLTCERTRQEMSFSLGVAVSAQAVGEWFGRDDLAAPGRVAASPGTAAGSGVSLTRAATIVAAILWLINLPIIVFGDGSLFLTGLAHVALVPAVARQVVGERVSSAAPYGAFAAFVILLATILNLSEGDGGVRAPRSWGSGGSGFSTGGGHK